MDKDVAVRQLCEYYGIPPHHSSVRKGNTDIKANLEATFKLPLEEIEKLLKFEQVRNFWDNQTRRIGKDITAIIKHITR